MSSGEEVCEHCGNIEPTSDYLDLTSINNTRMDLTRCLTVEAWTYFEYLLQKSILWALIYRSMFAFSDDGWMRFLKRTRRAAV
jgi:hypothetical protein